MAKTLSSAPSAMSSVGSAAAGAVRAVNELHYIGAIHKVCTPVCNIQHCYEYAYANNSERYLASWPRMWLSLC